MNISFINHKTNEQQSSPILSAFDSKSYDVALFERVAHQMVDQSSVCFYQECGT